MHVFSVLVAALALAVVGEQAASATFTFSFQNTAEGGGLVQGIVSGLADEGVSAATSLRVTSNTLGFGIGEYVGAPTDNSFEVSGGQVRSFVFGSFGAFNAAPDVQCCSLFMNGGVIPDFTGAGLANNPDSVSLGFDTGLTFTPAAIPLPAPVVLLGAAIAALAGLGLNRSKRPAAA